MSLVYFILCGYGLTQILAYSSVFDKIRPEHHFFRCPMCLGFWSGVFLVGVNKYTELFTYDNSIINYFLLGCLSSGTSYVLCTLFGDNGVKYEHTCLGR